jgi:hypothetical protein
MADLTVLSNLCIFNKSTYTMMTSICKITSPIPFFSCWQHRIWEITLKRQRCPDVAFIDRSKNTTQLQARNHVTLILGYELCSHVLNIQCPSVKLDNLSRSFISISFLTNVLSNHFILNRSTHKKLNDSNLVSILSPVQIFPV